MIKTSFICVLVMFGFVSKDLSSLNPSEKEAAISLGKLDGRVIVKNGDISVSMYSGSESRHLDGISDKDIDMLVRLKDRVVSLDLETNNISSTGLRKISEFRRLHYLRIMNKNFDDSCKIIFTNCPLVEDLSLNHARITKETIMEIVKIKTITRLELIDSTIHDEDLQYLKELPNLKNLILSKTLVTDKGLESFSSYKLEKLQYLWLDYTNISDIGAEHLSKIKTLSNISMIGTKVTKKMAKKLEKELFSPDKIDFDIRIEQHEKD